jgi:hypothetical protein
VAIALLGHGVLGGHRVAFWARLELRWKGRLELDGRGSLGRVADPLVVWIAAGVPDTLISRKVMLEEHASRNRPLTDLIENPVGL